MREHHASVSLIAAPLLLFAAVPCGGCGAQKNSVAAPLTPVTVTAVEEYSGAEGNTYSASIVPYIQLQATFKSAGYLTSILQRKGADGRSRNVQQGDFVKKDTVLATVRQEDYSRVLEQYKGQLEQASAAAEKAKQDFARASALYAANAMTQSDYDAAKAQNDSTQGSLVTAQASVNQAEQSLTDCELRAPMDSVVLGRNVEVGALVATGTPGFTLGDTTLVKAVFGVPDTMLGNINLGKKQAVRTESFPQEFIGQITAISPQADQKSRTFQVEVTIPNPRDLLKSGMVVTLDLGQTRLSHPVLVVPLSAIVSVGDGTNTFSVFVITHDNGTDVAHRRAVQPGGAYGNKVGILRGLNSGDRVISNGANLVTDGQTVRVIP
jgi:RND family efflux transporter MFP subunit